MLCEETANKVLRFPAQPVKLPSPNFSRATLYASLERAKNALAAQLMTDADVTAWHDMSELQQQILRQI